MWGGMTMKGQPEGDLCGEWICVLIVVVFAHMCTWEKMAYGCTHITPMTNAWV